MDSTSLTKPVDLQGLSLALAKTKADYMAYVDAATADYMAYVDAATAGITTNLSDLTDTSISTPQPNQTLIFHERSGKWVNMNIPYHSITTLTDTSVSNPADGQVLQYDATNEAWVNTTLPAGITETRVNELIAVALAQYGDGDTASYGYTDASEVNY